MESFLLSSVEIIFIEFHEMLLSFLRKLTAVNGGYLI